MVRTILQSRFPFLSNGTAPVFLRIFRWQDFLGHHGCSSIPVADRLQDRREVLLYKSSAIRTFCTIGDLSIKKCVPLNSNILKPMAPEAANALIAKVPEWNLVNEDGVMKLHRSWKVKTFMRGLQFFQLVADVAEAEGHHPDLHLVGWNNVKINIWTHAVGGLTENDFILAAKINGLNLHHLLSIAK